MRIVNAHENCKCPLRNHLVKRGNCKCTWELQTHMKFAIGTLMFHNMCMKCDWKYVANDVKCNNSGGLLGMLFLPNRGVSPFYAASCFNELSRGFVLCLFVTRFGRAALIATTSFLCAKIDDPRGRRGDRVPTLAGWRRPVASNLAQDVLHQAICTVLCWRITMAIKMTRERRVFFHHCWFVVAHKRNYRVMINKI